MAQINIYICDSPEKAATAKGDLEGQGFPSAQITVEEASLLAVDAATYDGGDNTPYSAKWLVTGRR